jgi:hypothetical protein
MDAILNIAIRSDYPTILSFICTCKYFSEYKTIWKLACEARFPTRPYFDFWTGEENYLVSSRKIFALLINFSVESVLFRLHEYYPMLSEILEEAYLMINAHDEFMPMLLELTPQSQYVVAKLDHTLTASVVGQFATYEKAKITIPIDYLESNSLDKEFVDKSYSTADDNISSHSQSLDEDLNDIGYAIINLARTIPYFWKIKPRTWKRTKGSALSEFFMKGA